VRELAVSAIENGTVIDHIDNPSIFKVVDILRLQEQDEMVLVGVNLPSEKHGKKGLLKVSERRLTQDEVNKVALIAPNASVNIIRNFQVVQKFTVEISDEISGIVRCFNPNCVTNNQDVPTRFHVEKRNPIELRCHYCERCMESKDMELT